MSEINITIFFKKICFLLVQQLMTECDLSGLEGHLNKVYYENKSLNKFFI